MVRRVEKVRRRRRGEEEGGGSQLRKNCIRRHELNFLFTFLRFS